MKRLTKTLLINWLYYEKLVLEFSDINYMVGKNSSGKSTFIDALMIVLLGEVSSRNFNKAANEGAQRSLKRYLRADMDKNNPKARSGRTFNTYIACEFWDDVSGKNFTAGVVFDCYADGSERYNFFTYDDKLPEDHFIIDRKPMDISELRSYLRDNYKSRQEIYDSNKKYRAAIKAKWNIHVDQVFSALKQGAFFKPIDDIREFITKHICDIQEKPDIVSMQQNIQDYKHQEVLAERLEKKLEHLRKIQELFRGYTLAQELLDIHEFLKAKAEVEIESGLIAKYDTELVSCRQELEELIEERKRLLEEKGELEILRDRLIASEPFKEFERLESEKARLTAEREELFHAMEKTATAVRAEIFGWLKYCQDFEEAPWTADAATAKLIDDLPDIKSTLKGLEKLSPDDFGRMDPALFTEAHEALARHMDMLRETCFELERTLAQTKSELDDSSVSLRELEKGNKDYPDQFLKFRAALNERLSTDNGLNIPLHPLADLLEITDPVWQRAVEGYLNTQRFLLIIDPEYYPDALRAYNKIKREFPGYGIVDVEKVRQRGDIQRLPNSLATKVEPINSLAEEYVNFLLGRVICCERVEDLRDHRSAITAEGMLYQGYVARAIPRQLLESVYIGKRALQQQIEAKKEQIRELSALLENKTQTFIYLEKQKKKEIRLTKYYIEDTILQMPKNHARCQEIVRELQGFAEKLEELERKGLLSIVEQKEETVKKIRENDEKYDNCGKTVGARENRIKNLEYEILPDHYQKMAAIEDLISERFTETFINGTGEPRYIEELSRLKSHKNILKSYGEQQVEQTKRRCDESWRSLVYERRDYINSFPPCSYRADTLINDDFDNELEHLSQVQLPDYKDKIKAAHESAIEQFQNDFIAKLTSSIKIVQDQVGELNKALKRINLPEQYYFVVEKSPDYAEYYNMIMDPDWTDSNEGLFAIALQNRYGILIEELFRLIVASDDVALNAKKQSELQENIEKYTDYRTYLHFDLRTTDQNDNVEYLSMTLKSKSGGETQTPFYIAILASFAQVYKTHDRSSFGNTMRLVVFDEAFSKMDSERIVQCIRLLRKMELQAIFSTPPDKLPDIMPESDVTYLAYHDKAKYKMHIEPWSKETEGQVLEL